MKLRWVIAILVVSALSVGSYYYGYVGYLSTIAEEGARKQAELYFSNSIKNTGQEKLISFSSTSNCTLLNRSNSNLPQLPSHIRFIFDCTIQTTCDEPLILPVFIYRNGAVMNPSTNASIKILNVCPEMISNTELLNLPTNYQTGG